MYSWFESWLVFLESFVSFLSPSRWILEQSLTDASVPTRRLAPPHKNTDKCPRITETFLTALIPWSRMLIERLKVRLASQQIPTFFYEIDHSMPYPRKIAIGLSSESDELNPHPLNYISLISILISSSYLYPGLPSHVYYLGFQIKISTHSLVPPCALHALLILSVFISSR